MKALHTARPVFHSEADFQHALAWVVHTVLPHVRVRLETRPAPGVHLDVAVDDPTSGERLAVELKYLTAAWSGTVDGESFQLLNQGAQDIRAYDIVKDLCRVERIIAAGAASRGAVIVLTNDPAYWTRPGHGRVTNADAFRVYDGNGLAGARAWGPVTGAGTTRGRESALELAGIYLCEWRPFSMLAGQRGEFRYLMFDVDPTDVRSVGR